MNQITVISNPNGKGYTTVAPPGQRQYHANQFFLRPDFKRLATFMPLIDKHCHWLAAERFRCKSHVDSMRSGLRTFLGYLQNVRGLDIGPGNVDKRIAKAFQKWNVDKGVSHQWIYGLQACLRFFFEWLHFEGILPNNQIKDIPLPPLRRGLPRPMDQKDILKVLSLLDIDDFLERRDLCIFEVMYGSGTRIGDTLRLKIKDIVFDDGILGPHLRLWTKGNKEALVPLSKASIGILKLHLLKRGHKSTEERLFVGKGRSGVSVQAIADRWKGYLIRANLNPRLVLYQLRHSTATHLYENGMPLEKIQRVLIHSNLSTSTIYTRVSPQQTFAACRKADIRGLVEKYRVGKIRGTNILSSVSH